MKSDKDNFYKTSDLALAVAVSLSCPIEKIEKANYGKSYFCFRRDEKLEQLIQSYWRQELKVEPQNYFNQLKITKARLYADD